jgi:hypothetical protein
MHAETNTIRGVRAVLIIVFDWPSFRGEVAE